MKPDSTENIEESSQHGTDLSIAVNEGTGEPRDDDAVQRAANGGYEVPLTLEEVNESVYTELNEATVSRNPSDATRSLAPARNLFTSNWTIRVASTNPQQTMPTRAKNLLT